MKLLIHFRSLAIQLQILVIGFLLCGCGNSKFLAISTENQQYPIKADATENKEINSYIIPFRDSLNDFVNQVLATSEVELTVGRQGKDLQPTQIALGNFVTDAILEIAKQKAKELNKPTPDISFFVWGSLRKSLPAGEITLRNVYETMPFENEMVVLKLTGAQITTLLIRLSGNFNPISGASMNKSEISSIRIQGKPISDNEFYYVLTSDYHAFGGDNMTVLLEAKDQYMCGIKVRDALALYLQQLTAKKETLKPDYEPRIKN